MPKGFASMSKERRTELARKGGINVPVERRSYSQNRELARSAGKKGGRNVSASSRSFSQNRALAQAAGRKGGLESQRKRKLRSTERFAQDGRPLQDGDL